MASYKKNRLAFYWVDSIQNQIASQRRFEYLEESDNIFTFNACAFESFRPSGQSSFG